MAKVRDKIDRVMRFVTTVGTPFCHVVTRMKCWMLINAFFV